MLTRQLLRLFDEYKHPVNIITKSHLIVRDIDLLGNLANNGLCSVAISIPTMNDSLKRIMEPRVPAAESRLKAIRQIADAGVPVSILVAPIIPAINDSEIEAILEAVAVADADASNAHYVFLRLPHELLGIFEEWLGVHFPDRAEHVLSLVRQSSDGKSYNPRYGRRQRGSGPYADMLAARFKRACLSLRLGRSRYQQTLDCSAFLHPAKRQLGLGF